MKRLCIRALVLCAMLMVVTVTASAISGTVSNLHMEQDANVDLKPLTEAGEVITAAADGTFAGARKFQITLGQTEEGKLYLPMIRTGEGVPTESNLYWADYQSGNGGSLTFTASSTKLMADGAYEVWLASGSEDVKKVASFQFKNEKTTRYFGDTNGDGEPTTPELLPLMLAMVNRNWTPEQLALCDVNGDGEPTTKDDFLPILLGIVNRKFLVMEG